MNAVRLRLGTRQEYPVSSLLSHIALGVTASAVTQEKEIAGTQTWTKVRNRPYLQSMWFPMYKSLAGDFVQPEPLYLVWLLAKWQRALTSAGHLCCQGQRQKELPQVCVCPHGAPAPAFGSSCPSSLIYIHIPSCLSVLWTSSSSMRGTENGLRDWICTCFTGFASLGEPWLSYLTCQLIV